MANEIAMMDCSRNLSAKIALNPPPLEELAKVIESGLSTNFAQVQVSVVDCPDLSQPPYHLAATGLCGEEKVAEVGGVGNLLPTTNKQKSFNLRTIADVCETKDAFILGPGAGPWPAVGCNCEMVANCSFANDKEKVATKIAKINPLTGAYVQEDTSSVAFSLMANLLVSKGQPGKVLRVWAKNRTGPHNFPNAIRGALADRYQSTTVTMAGVFLLNSGKAKLHVMPDFPAEQMTSDEDVNKWLQFFEMKAPLVCASVVHSHDPGYHLRMEHTHCFSEHGDSGHYHYDTTPAEVEYEGYFIPANSIYRIDEVPLIVSSITVDESETTEACLTIPIQNGEAHIMPSIMNGTSEPAGYEMKKPKAEIRQQTVKPKPTRVTKDGETITPVKKRMVKKTGDGKKTANGEAKVQNGASAENLNTAMTIPAPLTTTKLVKPKTTITKSKSDLAEKIKETSLNGETIANETTKKEQKSVILKSSADNNHHHPKPRPLSRKGSEPLGRLETVEELSISESSQSCPRRKTSEEPRSNITKIVRPEIAKTASHLPAPTKNRRQSPIAVHTQQVVVKPGSCSPNTRRPNITVSAPLDGLVDLPAELVQHTLSFLSYEQTALIRPTCKKMNQQCGDRLIDGYRRMALVADSTMAKIRRKLPFKDVDRMDHPLQLLYSAVTHFQTMVINPVDVITSAIDEGICCFPYGRLLDEGFRFLRLMNNAITMYSVSASDDQVMAPDWKHAADLARVAGMHYKEKLAPILEQKLGDVFRLKATYRLQKFDSWMYDTQMSTMEREATFARDDINWEIEQIKTQNQQLKKENRELRQDYIKLEARVEMLEHKFKTVGRLLQ